MISPSRPLPSFRPIALAVVLALVIAIGLGLVAAGDRLVPGDVRVAQGVQGVDNNLLGAFADIGNFIGTTLWASLAIAVALVIAGFLRSRADVVFLATLLFLRLLGTQLKPIFNSPRPTEEFVLITGIHDGTGYPSGHSLTAATLALGLAVLAWRHIPSRYWAIGTIAVLVGLMLLVGWARIWTGAHWPSDVVGGFAFGVATVGIGVMVLNWQIASGEATASDHNRVTA